MKEFVERYRWIVELIGLVAIIASLVFVGLQLRQTQVALENDRNLARLELQQARRAEVNAHSEIWTRGNAGESLSAVERTIYENLLQDRWAQANTLALTSSMLGGDARTNPSVLGFARFLYENPGARQAWVNRMTQSAETESLLTSSRVSFSVASYVLEYLDVLDNEDEK